MSFNKFNLHPSILQAITEAGYDTPTPIQDQAIPLVLEGKDLMASAQTGTGKTAAFVVPALNKLTEPSTINSRGPRVLILTPTRELATQVAASAQKYSRHLPRIKTVCVLGGMPYPVQMKQLRSPFEILVATPGRLIDYIERNAIDFSRLEMLVLDEADRMLDMGFIEDVGIIVRALPQKRQTLMFSATLKSSIAQLAGRMLTNPVHVTIAASQARHDHIEQRLHYVDDISHKNRLLEHLLDDRTINQSIVFTATKRNADDLMNDLVARGYDAAALHGDMSQRVRNRTISRLRKGEIKILIATDVAARGIDIPGITHVINFDLPQSSEDYVHRIGRTGRAGSTGVALSFASRKDMFMLEKIERYTGTQLKPSVIPGLEPRFKPVPQQQRSSRDYSSQPSRGGGRGDQRRRSSFGQGSSSSQGDRRGGSSSYGDRRGGSSQDDRRGSGNGRYQPSMSSYVRN